MKPAAFATWQNVRCTGVSAAKACKRCNTRWDLARGGYGLRRADALAVLARVTDDPSLRAAALAEGEMVLNKGSVGHNRVWYYRVAGDAQIDARNWLEANQCADQLHAVTAAEPLPLVEYIVARIKALSAVGLGERMAGLRAEIDRLIDKAMSRVITAGSLRSTMRTPAPGSVRGELSGRPTENLNGHEGGSGGHSQGDPKAMNESPCSAIAVGG